MFVTLIRLIRMKIKVVVEVLYVADTTATLAHDGNVIVFCAFHLWLSNRSRRVSRTWSNAFGRWKLATKFPGLNFKVSRCQWCQWCQWRHIGWLKNTRLASSLKVIFVMSKVRKWKTWMQSHTQCHEALHVKKTSRKKRKIEVNQYKISDTT